MERLTRQRQAVLDALSSSGRTLSPPEILALAQRHAPGMNLSTVYRQVRSLEEDGTVLRVRLAGQADRYELCCTLLHGPEAAPAARPAGSPRSAGADPRLPGADGRTGAAGLQRRAPRPRAARPLRPLQRRAHGGAAMSPPGRPKGECRSAQHEGSPVSPPGRPKGEYRSAQHEGSPVSAPGRSLALIPPRAARRAFR
ncbi:transcriptional repressor [Piscinibacter sakaiensis]|uniref:Fur family transcriptional regulator n=1 Tax=Piscinibacter sakaiensis TaxID=1547922 RepID=UPI003727D167